MKELQRHQPKEITDVEKGLNDGNLLSVIYLTDGKSGASWSRKKRFFIGALGLLGCFCLFISVGLIATYSLRNVVPTEASADNVISASVAAVAADHPMCSQMGSVILKSGGNAVDAAVTTTLCQGLLQPVSAGIGGGCLITIWMDGAAHFINGRETAPAASEPDMFVNHPSDSVFGGKAVAVPGELAALYVAHQKYGQLDWKVLFQPVISLANDGFPIGKYVAASLNTTYANFPEPMKRLYGRHGRPLQEGEVLRRPDLARTLQLVADNGPEAFYKGPVAEAIVKTITDTGGIMTIDDLANYQALSSSPLEGFYKGLRVLSSPPPSSGGAVVLMLLNIMEGFSVGRPQGGPRPSDYHYMVEAMAHAFADRMLLGDPAFVDVSAIVANMTSKFYAAKIRSKIKKDQTFNVSYYGGYFLNDDHGTSHVSVVDSKRNAVSITSTINSMFGSKVLVEEYGILLNNEMDDFSTPNVSNQFGLAPSVPNYPAGGKRPLSSMSPTIVLEDDRLLMVTGASGGPSIITSTFHSIMNTCEYGLSPPDAVRLPRIHHQFLPHKVYSEDGFPQDVLDYLRDIGHEIAPGGSSLGHALGLHFIGDVQLVYFDSSRQLLTAISDARKHGKPAGF